MSASNNPLPGEDVARVEDSVGELEKLLKKVEEVESLTKERLAKLTAECQAELDKQQAMHNKIEEEYANATPEEKQQLELIRAESQRLLDELKEKIKPEITSTQELINVKFPECVTSIKSGIAQGKEILSIDPNLLKDIANQPKPEGPSEKMSEVVDQFCAQATGLQGTVSKFIKAVGDQMQKLSSLFDKNKQDFNKNVEKPFKQYMEKKYGKEFSFEPTLRKT